MKIIFPPRPCVTTTFGQIVIGQVFGGTSRGICGVWRKTGDTTAIRLDTSPTEAASWTGFYGGEAIRDYVAYPNAVLILEP